MPHTSGHLTKLVELAHERSSDKRRELLRDLSDLFVSSAEMAADADSREIADDILTTLAGEVEESVRAELADRFADKGDAPVKLINDLARDVIAVARPLLERSTAVSDDTLAHAARAHGGEHARVIAARPHLSPMVSDAVIATRDEGALVTLARNEGAEISRDGMERLVDHAESCPALHAPLVERAEMPPDLLNEMFFIVEDTLRERIQERNADLTEEQLEAALAAARERLARRPAVTPQDYDEAVRYVQSRKLRKKLNPKLLAELLLENEMTKFMVAFADLTGVSFRAARHVVANPSVDPLAIACRSAKFSRDDFLRIAMLRSTSSVREEFDADVLGQIYDALPENVADRVMRFVKLRDQSEDAA